MKDALKPKARHVVPYWDSLTRLDLPERSKVEQAYQGHATLDF